MAALNLEASVMARLPLVGTDRPFVMDKKSAHRKDAH
jgi:hypothetical protein